MKNAKMSARFMLACALCAGIAAAALPYSASAERRGLQEEPAGYNVDSDRQELVDRKPDNTAFNTRDREERAKTAASQSNENRSLEMTQRIRQEIVKRDELSSYAQNVKIITSDDGSVTLRGPVRNQAEKDLVGRIAMNVAGDERVQNQLEVAPDRESRG